MSENSSKSFDLIDKDLYDHKVLDVTREKDYFKTIVYSQCPPVSVN